MDAKAPAAAGREHAVDERFLVAHYRWPFPPTQHELDWPAVAGLAARLGRLTVLVPGDPARIYDDGLVRVEYLPAWWWGRLSRAQFVLSAMRRMMRAGRGPSIVACGSDPLGSLAAYGATRFGRGSLIVQIQDDFWGGFYLGSWNVRRRGASRLMSFLARRADAVRVLSEREAERVMGLGVAMHRVRVVRSRVDLGRFRRVEPGRESAPGMRFVFVGTLVERKGIRVLLPAFRDVARADLDAELVIVGEGPLRAWGEEWTRRSGLERRVRWLGRVRHREVKTLLETAHCLVLPSLAEGTPRVLMEAMALGVPCVATNVGGVPSVLPATVADAHLVVPGDSAALSEAMRKAAERRRQGQVDGEALRRWVEERFGIEQHLDGMAELFRDVETAATRA
jgi:glycosyltransferase involved in cell wall biosynthesis